MSLKKNDIIDLSKTVLNRLSKMGCESCKKDEGCSSEQLIFPKKIQKKGSENVDRISEQELRLLFIEEFKKKYRDLFYSIETPTEFKYSFGKSYEDIKLNQDGRSALIDMCIFKRENNEYQRILNIEFKHKNTTKESIEKDILKLISEERNGVFIHLLQNTDNGTFCNKNGTGVFNKYYDSFSDFQVKWAGENKSIQLVLILLSQRKLIHIELGKSDLENLKNIFLAEGNPLDINSISKSGWVSEAVE